MLHLLFLATFLTQDSTGTFWRQLSLTQDTSEVRRLSHSRGSLSTIDRSLALTRLYEITRSEQYGRAGETLIATELKTQPKNAWLHFALGEVLAVRSPRRFPLRAAEELRTALELDSLHEPAALALARLAIASREVSLMRDARIAALRITAHNSSPDLLTLVGELDRLDGTYLKATAVEASRERLEDAVHRAPSSGLARYNLAVTQLLNPSTRQLGYSNYLRAADTGDADALHYINADLLLVGDRDNLPDLDEPARKRSAVIDAFWSARAWREARTPAERLAEHFRRVSYARQMFGRPKSWTIPIDTFSARTGMDPGFDQRGFVYVRYGEPTEKIRTAAGGIWNESWVYNQLAAPAPLVFHFALPQQAGVGYEISSIGCSNSDWVEDRRSIGGRYGLLPVKCRANDELAVLSMNAEYQEQVDAALRTDAQPWAFPKSIAFAVDVLGFRSPNGGLEYTAVFAVPAAQQLRTADGRYAFHVRLLVGDSTLGHSAELDTTIVFASTRPLRETDAIRASANLLLDSVRTPFYRFLLRSSADTTVGRVVGGPVSNDLAGALALSDIVLADTMTTGGFRRGPVRLNLAPNRSFAGSSFRVLYEVYGLERGADYETTFVIKRVDGGLLRRLGGRAEELTLRFPGTATSAEAWRQQEVRLVNSELEAGDYRLTVRVRDASHHEVERTTTFRVSDDLRKQVGRED